MGYKELIRIAVNWSQNNAIHVRREEPVGGFIAFPSNHKNKRENKRLLRVRNKISILDPHIFLFLNPLWTGFQFLYWTWYGKIVSSYKGVNTQYDVQRGFG